MDFRLIGQQIKAARKAQHLTQKELGTMTGLTSQHISVIERGIKLPTIQTFVDIANALHISADSLLKDVLNTAVEVESTRLSQNIRRLPIREQETVLKVVDVLTNTEEGLSLEGSRWKPKPIGTKIQEARKAKKLTQEQLAEISELSSSYISAVERGARMPKLETLIELANHLEVSAGDLVENDANVSIKAAACDLWKQVEKLSKAKQRRIIEVLSILAEG